MVKASGSVFRTQDGGRNWAASTLPFSATCLERSFNIPSLVLAGTAQGLFKSSDHGRTFREVRVKGLSPYVSAVALDAANPDNYYVGTDQGVFHSLDGGLSWTLQNSGLIRRTLSAVALSRSSPSDVLLFGAEGAYVSRTSGNSWTPSREGLTTSPPRKMIISPADPNLFYVSDGSAVSLRQPRRHLAPAQRDVRLRLHDHRSGCRSLRRQRDRHGLERDPRDLSVGRPRPDLVACLQWPAVHRAHGGGLREGRAGAALPGLARARGLSLGRQGRLVGAVRAQRPDLRRAGGGAVGLPSPLRPCRHRPLLPRSRPGRLAVGDHRPDATGARPGDRRRGRAHRLPRSRPLRDRRRDRGRVQDGRRRPDLDAGPRRPRHLRRGRGGRPPRNPGHGVRGDPERGDLPVERRRRRAGPSSPTSAPSPT